jgi:cytochrome c oxidase subunit 2
MKGDHVATGPVKTHIQLVLQGVPGTAMQAFGPQLDDVTLAAIITYQRNAWGNAHLTQKSTVQPEDVVKCRSKLKDNIVSKSQT